MCLNIFVPCSHWTISFGSISFGSSDVIVASSSLGIVLSFGSSDVIVSSSSLGIVLKLEKF